MELVAGQSASSQTGNQRTSAGDHFDGVSSIDDSTDDSAAGIADGGRACIGNKSHSLSALESIKNLIHSRCFIEAVATHQRLVYLVMKKESSRVARIFCGDDITRFECGECAQRDVIHVADGSGDDLQDGVGCPMRHELDWRCWGDCYTAGQFT